MDSKLGDGKTAEWAETLIQRCVGCAETGIALDVTGDKEEGGEKRRLDRVADGEVERGFGFWELVWWFVKEV